MLCTVAVARERQAAVLRSEGKNLKSFKRLCSALLRWGGNKHPTTEIKISWEDGWWRKMRKPNACGGTALKQEIAVSSIDMDALAWCATASNRVWKCTEKAIVSFLLCLWALPTYQMYQTVLGGPSLVQNLENYSTFKWDLEYAHCWNYMAPEEPEAVSTELLSSC